MFKNPLSQSIYDQSNRVLELAPDQAFAELEEIKTLDGKVLGSIKVFKGRHIQKLVISEFTVGPGMVSSLVVAKPEYCFNVPRFGADFSLMGDKLHLDTDLFPHFDLGSDLDYFNRHYLPFAETYQRFADEFALSQPKALWLRNYTSPFFFMADVDPAHQQALQAVAEAYYQQWLAIWQAETEALDQATTDAITKRAAIFEQISLETNPVKGMFNKILGEALTSKVLAALY